MAIKKTVVQMYEQILSHTTDAEERTFLEKRIEITKAKNAKRSTDPTPKQLEQMAANAEIENAVLGVMVAGVAYTPTDLVKMLGRTDVTTPQKLTPRLGALVDAGKVAKTESKGRNLYSLVE